MAFMAISKPKLMAALFIWGTVCLLAWRALHDILPKYGIFGRPTVAASRVEWEKQRKIDEEFFKQPVPSKIVIKVKRSDPASRSFPTLQDRRVNDGFMFVARDQKVKDIYASLHGIQSWQLTQAPESEERWNVWIRAPKNSREKLPQAFLDYMHWQMKEKKNSIDGYHVVATSPAPEPAPAANQGRQNRNRAMNVPMGSLCYFLQQRLNAPIQIDSGDFTRMPKPGAMTAATFAFNRPAQELLKQLPSFYGVEVRPEKVETMTFLVYHPKYATVTDMRRWEAGLK